MTTPIAKRASAFALVSATLLCACAAQAGSIRFFGNGANDIDRVKIRIDDPANSNPGPPADIGNGAFTIEFWIKGSAADNNNSVRCGQGVYGWIDGDIVIDRDRFNLTRSWGLSLGGGRVAFGVNVTNSQIVTVCGSVSVLDSQWHHVAVTRATSGTIEIFIDGTLDESVAGPPGDLSYPDDGQPQGNNCGGQPCFNSDPFIVLGAEKHDAVPGQLAFNGFMEELRLSTTVRYSGNFTPSAAPFTTDAATAALYHFDEATSGNCASGTVITDAANGGASPGECRFGGSPGGPVWSTDTPFGASPGSLQFSAATVPAAEGVANVVLTVTRAGGSTGAVSASYATANTGGAAAGTDYTAASGTVSFAAGSAANQPVTVGILDDAAVDPGESFTVTLSSPTGGATLGSPATVTVPITDNDSPGTLQLSAAGYAVTEGTPTRVITVTRLSGNAGAVTVNYATTDGTATQPNDYTQTNGTLTWPAGVSTDRTFTVPIVDDGQVESAETLTVSIAGASGGAMIGSPAAATLTIADNDAAQPGSLQLAQSTFTVNENAGTLTITVSRTNGSDGTAQVLLSSTDGSARAGSDFQLLNQTLTWASGDATDRTVTLTITNDSVNEPAENLTLGLTGATGASLGAPATATVTIDDDDPQGGSSGDGGGGGRLDLYLIAAGLLLARRKLGLAQRRLRQAAVLRPRL